MSVVVWATLGTIIGTLVLVVVPAVAYAWVVSDSWVAGRDRYPDV